MSQYEFHVSAKARKKYRFDEALFGLNGTVIAADFAAARRFAAQMGQGRGQPVPASEINAMGLIDEVLHLLSVISPVADDLAVVAPALLPAGLHELLGDLGIRTLSVDGAEFETLGCNVLAVRPGVVVLAAGNPRTASALSAAGCEVHTFDASEIGVNGSGGPTCLTRPILRDAM